MQDKSLIVNLLRVCSITVNETLTKNEVKEFWRSIWEKDKINKNVKLLEELEEAYCRDVIPKTYKID